MEKKICIASFGNDNVVAAFYAVTREAGDIQTKRLFFMDTPDAISLAKGDPSISRVMESGNRDDREAEKRSGIVLGSKQDFENAPPCILLIEKSTDAKYARAPWFLKICRADVPEEEMFRSARHTNIHVSDEVANLLEKLTQARFEPGEPDWALRAVEHAEILVQDRLASLGRLEAVIEERRANLRELEADYGAQERILMTHKLGLEAARKNYEEKKMAHQSPQDMPSP